METELSLAQIRQIEVEIQTEIHNFCETHGLKYFLCYGTLIGAIRHDGFIPWDDDLDIVMPRKDYDYFIRHFDTERFGVQSCETVKNYPYSQAKAYDKTTKKIEFSIHEPKGYQNGVDVDVFVLDDSKYPFLNRPKDTLRSIIRFFCIASVASYTPHFSLRNVAVFLVQKLFRISANSCARRMNRYSLKQAGGEMLMIGADSFIRRPIVLKREWFENRTLHPFEDKMFYVPGNSDAILRYIYGDYMCPPPEDKRVRHHDFVAYKIASEE